MTPTPEALRPCPFCGGKAEIVNRDVEPQGDPYYGRTMALFVLCECGASLFNSDFHESFWAVEQAIAAWNRRTEEGKWMAFNIVEMIADSDDCAFDQPCKYGHRVEGHAVYCHNDEWAESPRKCRRTWYTGGKERDEDCPGFAPNPDYRSEAK